MIPGYGPSRLREETIASAATVTVKADLVRVTGTTSIATINTPVDMGRDGVLVALVPVDGTVTLLTTGNILVGQAMAINRLYFLAKSNVAGKWYIHAVA